MNSSSSSSSNGQARSINFERLSQADVAELLNVDRRTVRRWETDLRMPRNRDGTYHSVAVIWWCVAKGIRPSR